MVESNQPGHLKRRTNGGLAPVESGNHDAVENCEAKDDTHRATKSRYTHPTKPNFEQ